MKFNKTQLLPILSIITGFIKETTGYEVGSEYVDLAANIIIMLIIPGIGFIINWKKDHLSDAEKNYISSSQ